MDEIMLTSDKKKWLYGDESGLMRVTITPKKLTLKNSIKSTAQNDQISASGKFLLANGRLQKGVYGNDQLMLLSLPGLGLKQSTSSCRAAALVSTPEGERVLRLTTDELTLSSFDGSALTQTGTIALRADTALPSMAIGPQSSSTLHSPSKLVSDESGRFFGLINSTLWAGSVTEGVAWSRPITIHPTVKTMLAVTEDTMWFGSMDHATSTLHLVGFSSTGAVRTLTLQSLSLPGVDAQYVLYQPDNHTIVRRSLSDNSEERFDVTAHNTHPYESPRDEFFKTTRPADPTVLPGHASPAQERIFFVPWHQETVVELTSQTTLSRGLAPAGGPFRRGLREINCRDNLHLAPLQIQVSYPHIDTVLKRSSSPFQLLMPTTDATLINQIATDHAFNLTERFEMRTHGWSWGSFGQSGGPRQHPRFSTVESVEEALLWMISADVIPLESKKSVRDAYTNAMGIPSNARPDEMIFDAAGERLWLRAMLETVRDQGWKTNTIPQAWKSEPITAALAMEAIEGLHDWKRRGVYEGMHLLSLMLAHHIGVAAHPVLVKLLQNYPKSSFYGHHQTTGEALVWLCHKHPELRDASIAAVRAVAGIPEGEWTWIHDRLTEALGRSAKHLWSNG
ncbi:MAG: hypothetical protein ACI8S6_000074 [Myxococcota bacterium]|jgi:hypothetical protein